MSSMNQSYSIRHPLFKYMGYLCLVIVISFLSSCKTVEKELPKNSVELVQVLASNDVNGNHPVSVDIVFVFDQLLETQIQSLTAKQWFSQKAQFVLQYPKGFIDFEYELVPGSHINFSVHEEKDKFPIAHRKAIKVMVYANYLKETPLQSANISPYKNTLVTLNNDSIAVKENP